MPTSRTKSGDLFTLTEVSKKTSISMRTLLRYKKLYQRRIPSVGKGRGQRYPEEALAVFDAIKMENLAKRARPKKKAPRKEAAKKRKAARKAVKRAAKKTRATKTPKKVAAKKRPARRKAAAKKTVRRKAAKRAPRKKKAPPSPVLLSLSEISHRTGISYPTLLRYVKLHLKQIPHKGRGRKRRYPEKAVAVFKELRSRTSRGRRKKAAPRARRGVAVDVSLHARIRGLERAQAQISKQLDQVIATLKKPVRVTISSG